MKNSILASLLCFLCFASAPFAAASNVTLTVPGDSAATTTETTGLAPAHYPPQPVLYKLQHGATTVYLFGSVHSLPKGLKWRNQAFNDAVARSDKIWFESTIREMANPTLMIDQILSADNNQVELKDLLTPAQMAKLTKVAKAQNLDIMDYNNYHPWVISFILQGARYKTDVKKNADHEIKFVAGVEKTIIDMRMGKPTLPLENTRQHVLLFSKMSPAEEVALLMNTVDQIDNVLKDNIDKTVEDWSKGDLASIEAENEAMKRNTPGLYKIMVTLRNQEQADGISRILTQGSGTNFVAVGAAHLPGEEGIVRLLQQKGFTAEPVYSLDAPVESGATDIEIIAPHYRTDLHIPDYLNMSLLPGKTTDQVRLHFVWPQMVSGCVEITPIKARSRIYDDSVNIDMLGYFVNIPPYPNVTPCDTGSKQIAVDIPLDIQMLKNNKTTYIQLNLQGATDNFKLRYEDGTLTLGGSGTSGYFFPVAKNLSVTGL